MSGLIVNLEVKQNRLKKFQDNMQLFQKHLHGLRGDLLKQEAALTSLEFINRTSPIKPQEGVENAGLSQGAKKVGEAAVERDIRSIFKPTDYMLAGAVDTAYGSIEAFQKWKNKPLPRGSNDVIRRIWGDQDVQRAFTFAQNFMGKRDMSRGLDDMGSLRTVHERERNSSRRRGRITSKAAGGPSQDIKGPPYKPYFANANVIEKYIKLRQQMVGKAKSGWWMVISKLGTININGKTQRPTGSKVPAWVRRNAKGTHGFVQRLPDNKKVTITNLWGNVNNIAKESGDIVAEVINARNVRLGNNPYMQRAINKAISMWNNGQIK